MMYGFQSSCPPVRCFSYQRKLELIAQETALDGVYVLRTSLESTLMDAATTVKAYKSLSQVEEAFRCYKSIDLKVRPIYHYKGNRVALLDLVGKMYSKIHFFWRGGGTNHKDTKNTKIGRSYVS